MASWRKEWKAQKKVWNQEYDAPQYVVDLIREQRPRSNYPEKSDEAYEETIAALIHEEAIARRENETLWKIHLISRLLLLAAAIAVCVMTFLKK